MKKHIIVITSFLYLFSVLFSPFSYKVNADTAYRNWGNGVSVVSSGSNSETTEINSIIPDGSGGTIVAWRDVRNGNNDVFAQRFNGLGVPQWTTNGVVISTATGSQNKAVITSDGNGGAIIAWEDARTDSGDIYAQRVDSNGSVQWTANGVVITAASNAQATPSIVSDGLFGAIITWVDSRGASLDIYAQRIDASGTVQWTANGVVVSGATGTQTGQDIVSDNNNGAVIVWADSRSGTSDIYGQRINSSGVVQWTANGVVICNATGAQNSIVVTTDNSFNTILGWTDARNGGGDFSVYVQKVDSAGVSSWTANGVVVGDTTGTQIATSITVDGQNNTYISWGDTRTDAGDIYVQKVNSTGTIQFTSNGIAIASSINEQSLSQIIADRITNNVFIVWYDKRISSIPNIYGQKINSSGTALWQSNGVMLSNFTSNNTVFLVSRLIMSSSESIIYDIYESDLTTRSLLQQVINISRYNVTTFSDQMSRINESTVSSHTIKFVSANGVGVGQSIAVTLPAGFAFGSSYDFNDVTLAEGTSSNCVTAGFLSKTLAAAPSGTTWGATYSSQTVTFTSGTNTITAGNCVRVVLNSNAVNHTLTNPTVTSDTVYNPTIIASDQQGQAAVIILNDVGTPDSDQIQINGNIYTTISLDLDTVVTGCSNSTETSLNTVDLGILTPGTVKKSDTTIKYICIDAATNAGLGINIFARSNRSNAVGALVSGANSIASATADLTLSGTTSGYGIRVSSVGTPSLGSLTINSPFNSGTSGSVGALPGILSAAAQIVDSTGPVQTGTSSRIAVEVAAKASNVTLAGAYSDIITFTALVNF